MCHKSKPVIALSRVEKAPSSTGVAAGAFGFLTLIHAFDGPEQQARSCSPPILFEVGQVALKDFLGTFEDRQ
jgi:hypothetical protein